MNFIRQTIILFLILLAAYAIYSWRVEDMPLPEKAVAGRDGAANRKVQSQDTNIGEFFESFVLEDFLPLPSSNWSQFRGDNRDNIVEVDSSKLNFDFNNTKPKVLWRVSLGEGYAAPAISNGKVYVLDYDEAKQADMLRCFSFEDGKELWRRWYEVKIKRNHGVSRTVPAVAEGVVVALAPMGHLMAVDANSGELLWSKDLVKEYGSVIPQWYTGQCPLIDNSTVIIAPAGNDVLLMGIDLRSGETLWQTDNTEGFKMSHSSVMMAEVYGQKQYVYGALGGTVSVSADGENSGEILWINKDFKPNVFAPSPVYLGEAKFLLTAGYGAGGALLKVSETESENESENESEGKGKGEGEGKSEGEGKGAGKYATSLLKRWKPKEAISSEQQSPIFHNGKVYAIMPKDAGKNFARFICADTNADTLYISDTEYKFGLGPYILIGDTFLILDDDGGLYSIQEEGDTLKVKGFAKILNGHDSWGPLAYSDCKIIARDMDEMICISLKKEEEE